MHRLLLVLVAATASVLSVPAPAQPLETKLVDSDPEEDDSFGWSVSLDGDRAIIGAKRDDPHLANQGSAFIFERQPNGDWIEVVRLTASDPNIFDEFGSAVALSGDVVVVGSQLDDGPVSEARGSAYVFERQGDGTWLETTKLVPSEGGEGTFFGSSAVLSGTRLLVGARRDLGVGSAYVFERQRDGSWLEVALLEASDGTVGDVFGASVAIDGDRALIGARQDDDAAFLAGSAYIFERQEGGTWLEVAKLLASDGQEWDTFGDDVALSGDVAFIGAPGDDDHAESSGAVYVFERQGDGSWMELDKLTIPGSGMALFGDAVSMEGETLLVGARGADNGSGILSGAAYVYQRQEDGSWLRALKLTASEGDEFDWFGHAVSLSGDRALVGAYRDEVAGFEEAGSAYIFEEVPIIVETRPEAPETATVSEVYPNPFTEQARITVTPATAQHVRVEVYDMLGRRVAVLHEGPLPGGVAKRFTLNAASLPGGVYVLRVVGETFVESRTLTVIR